MGIFDLQVPFFLPMWRRAMLVVVCLAWCVVEFSNASPFWGLVFGALSAYAFWQFFLSKWPDAVDNQREDTE